MNTTIGGKLEITEGSDWAQFHLIDTWWYVTIPVDNYDNLKFTKSG